MNSLWPICFSCLMLGLMIGAIHLVININMYFFIYSFTLLSLGFFLWFRDIIRESQGHHTEKIVKSLKLGMTLFILSEIMFFFSFFWAYFNSSLSPTIFIGCTWPPIGIMTVNPFSIPLLNTMILLTSGLTITWSHFSLLNNDLKKSILSLSMTLLLGIYFTFVQMIEYYHLPFSISDGIYGSVFYILTGFHGIHVIIGSLFIFVTLIRLKNYHFSSGHHVGFEMANWYWHFVDIVWLFLFIFVYWWGY